MKKLLLCSFSFLIAFIVTAQQDEFWGTTQLGGTGNAGVIFSMNNDGTGYKVRHNFYVDKIGSAPIYAPCLYNDTYYGITEQGGRYASGVLYSYNKTSKVYTLLHEFVTENGFRPLSNVVVINNKLYGTTYDFNKGLTRPGTIYEYDLTTNVYSLKKVFTNYTGAVLGARPVGSLTVYNGKIYGSTKDGGSGLAGSIFEYDPTSDEFRSLYGFGYSAGSYPNGKQPNGSLVLYNNELYGTTQAGGANGYGVIFKYNMTSNAFTKLADFGGSTNGSQPTDGMTLLNGIFYGATGYGGTFGYGTIYTFDPATSIVTYLHNFNYNGSTGSNPLFKLTLYNNLLYGSSTNAGIIRDGNIFVFDPSTNVITSEFSTGNDGESLNSDFLIDGNKFIAVTTQYKNSMISYDPATKKKETIFTFNTAPLGSEPNRSMLYDDGIFYSCTSLGGTNNLGVVFSFNPKTSVYKVLYNLTTAAYSLGDFTKMGNILYAPANSGYYNGEKTQNYGAVFWIDLATNNASYLSCTPGGAGMGPVGVMVPADFYPDQLLVVTTFGNSGSAGGKITKFSTTTNQFIGNGTSTFGNGSFPGYATKTSDGRVFVTTQYSGTYNQGTLHQQSVGTKTSFQSSKTGRGPNGAIAELNGKYYINTSYDGPVNGNQGTLVEIDPANMTTPVTKVSFTPAGGTLPYGNMVVANDKLYGVMKSGGKTEINTDGELAYLNRGTIFVYDPTTNTYTKLHDFNGYEGEAPTSLIKAPTSGVLPLRFISFTAKLCSDNNVCINWQTENEINVATFEILRSADGINFTAIGKVQAKNQPANNYNSEDNLLNSPNQSKWYYRIKQNDKDGKYTTSNVQKVELENTKTSTIYPNPVNEVLHITNIASISSVQITDIRGSKIKSWTSNFSSLPVNDIAAGIYMVKITLKNGKIVQQKMIKQ